MTTNPAHRCPTCGQLIQTYHRSITAAMAVALLILHRKGNGKWMHLPTLKMSVSNVKLRAALGGGDVAKLRFWNLLELLDGERPDGSSRVGYYRITPSGESFCMDMLRVPKYADVLHNEVLQMHGDMIGIRDALRQKFDYAELLAL